MHVVARARDRLSASKLPLIRHASPTYSRRFRAYAGDSKDHSQETIAIDVAAGLDLPNVSVHSLVSLQL
jgi:hypothetical protein